MKPQVPWLRVFVEGVVIVGLNLVAFGVRRECERQPFRSMGFVSVIIVSVLFAMGLPLVLL